MRGELRFPEEPARIHRCILCGSFLPDSNNLLMKICLLTGQLICWYKERPDCCGNTFTVIIIIIIMTMMMMICNTVDRETGYSDLQNKNMMV